MLWTGRRNLYRQNLSKAIGCRWASWLARQRKRAAMHDQSERHDHQTRRALQPEPRSSIEHPARAASDHPYPEARDAGKRFFLRLLHERYGGSWTIVPIDRPAEGTPDFDDPASDGDR
jgi:hypothetical protein